MNKPNKTDKEANIIFCVGSADIGLTLNGIADDLGLSLDGEVIDLAGILNRNAAYDVQLREGLLGIHSPGDWGYYAKRVSGMPGELLKAWVRWNAEAEIYDYYLDAGAGAIFDHAPPYVGTLYERIVPAEN